MKKIMICLLFAIGLFIINPIDVQANDILPKAGFQNLIFNIDPIEIERYNYTIENHNGFKAYMSYKTITDKTSFQYKLQKEAYTDEEGFRKFDNRYCVAIGTAFDVQVGQYFDAQLKDGTIIKCIVGDIKADCDTDKTNTFTSQGCCLEFIVETNTLNSTVKITGDCSNLYDEWDSPCSEYIIYNIKYRKESE